MTKEELLTKYRTINTEYDEWYDCVYSNFTEDMKAKGIEVQRMFYSGFWSQGDGACFDGWIEDGRVFLDCHFTPADFPMIRKLLDCGGRIKLSVIQSGHYYHENCTVFDSDCDRLDWYIDRPSELQEQVVEAWQVLLDAEMDDFETQAKEMFRSHMRQLYRNLEKEYDHLTSDEVVWDWIVANEMTDELTQGDEA